MREGVRLSGSSWWQEGARRVRRVLGGALRCRLRWGGRHLVLWPLTWLGGEGDAHWQPRHPSPCGCSAHFVRAQVEGQAGCYPCLISGQACAFTARSPKTSSWGDGWGGRHVFPEACSVMRRAVLQPCYSSYSTTARWIRTTRCCVTVIPRTGGGKTGMSNETTFSMLLRQYLHRKHVSEFKKAREASCVRAPTNICSYGVLGHRRD